MPSGGQHGPGKALGGARGKCELDPANNRTARIADGRLGLFMENNKASADDQTDQPGVTVSETKDGSTRRTGQLAVHDDSSTLPVVYVCRLSDLGSSRGVGEG